MKDKRFTLDDILDIYPETCGMHVIVASLTLEGDAESINNLMSHEIVCGYRVTNIEARGDILYVWLEE